MTNTVTTAAAPTAHLDSAHVEDINGGMGTIRVDGGAPGGWGAKMKTLVAVLGPGLIVMVGDNDAGALGTYTQAGQNYGTTLLWTLFLLNALTIVTEFIGITLAVGYLGLPKVPSVIHAAILVVAAASTGSFRRFERLCLILVAGSLLLIPIYVLAYPPVTEMAHSFVTPMFPAGAELSTVMLLIIGIVGTTVAPWQLFFQQSYVIDKRITPRFLAYAKVDLWIGIVLVVVGGAAMFGFCAAAFAGTPDEGGFIDAGAVASGLEHYVSRTAGVLFAIACLTPPSSAPPPSGCPPPTRSPTCWASSTPCTASPARPRASRQSLPFSWGSRPPSSSSPAALSVCSPLACRPWPEFYCPAPPSSRCWCCATTATSWAPGSTGAGSTPSPPRWCSRRSPAPRSWPSSPGAAHSPSLPPSASPSPGWSADSTAPASPGPRP